MIENRVAGFRVTEKINQGNAIAARPCESADNKIEIRGGETCPTICPNHRTFRSSALTMPQPTLFEATFISVRLLSQDRPVPPTVPTLAAHFQIVFPPPY